ncbi:MAG TPA: hypothetical protein VNV66_13990, partial [Pilimelia sp.]|nr:hypothetical protein [Pilimelia sp.]
VVGLPPVALPPVTVPSALPRRTGSVPLDRTRKVRPERPGRPPKAVPKPPAAGQPSAPGTALNAPGPGSVQLRALVVGTEPADWGVATWRSTLDRVGAAYDVFYGRTGTLDLETLVRPDGVGRYNAILLTSNMLLYLDNGNYVAALDANEWNLLWAYQRDYQVRQATLYASHGTWPEDYCLTGVSEGGVGDTPLEAQLTSAGAGVFDYLRTDVDIPITQSYVYRTGVRPGCAGQSVLTAGADTLGVLTTSTDGRERLALTFTSNQYLLQSHLLAYGLFRWASRGLYFGERRHFLNVDIDDWFNGADHLHDDGTVETEPGYHVSGHDAYNLHLRQSALLAEHPQAAGFRMTLAYNGGDADLTAGNTCYPNGGVNTLTATSRCLANEFRWINHTLTHPEMNFTDYPTSAAEISANFAVGATLGLPTPGDVLKTGEYSGLGVYNPDPDDDTGPPTDYGLNASNPHLLAAARDLGVKYLHGNMSFPSHAPPCANCGIVHPMEPAVMVVPDWPTNIAYHTTTPTEQALFYNSFYGPNGRFPYWDRDLTYQEMLDYEADIAFSHVTSGSLYAHTFHIANVRNYGGGRTLVTDWLDAVLDRYDDYYQVPLLSPQWSAVGAYASSRNAHFGQLNAGVTAVYDRAAGTVTVTSPAAGTVTVSGAATAGHSTYGTEVSAPITLTAGGTVTFSPVVRP